MALLLPPAVIFYYMKSEELSPVTMQYIKLVVTIEKPPVRVMQLIKYVFLSKPDMKSMSFQCAKMKGNYL